jgi:hypothetical protein
MPNLRITVATYDSSSFQTYDIEAFSTNLDDAGAQDLAERILASDYVQLEMTSNGNPPILYEVAFTNLERIVT